jgi:tRNA A37 threonylcarbamoyladenosine dehydratase
MSEEKTLEAANATLPASYRDRFSGIGRLLGRDALQRFRKAHIAVVGVGGVGTWAAEALSRSGVGTITLIDLDDVCVSNVNRQLHALDGEIGRSKVTVMAERMRKIFPDGEVREVETFLTKANVSDLVPARGGASGAESELDVVIDAIDEVAHKCVLIDHCRRHGIPLVVAGGAGGKQDPTKVRCGDLAHATHDRLLKKVRRTLRQEFGYPEDEESRSQPLGVEAIYSAEDAVFPWADGTVRDSAEPAVDSPVRLNCDSGFGTASFVTGTFGFAAAAAALRLAAQQESR